MTVDTFKNARSWKLTVIVTKRSHRWHKISSYYQDRARARRRKQIKRKVPTINDGDGTISIAPSDIPYILYILITTVWTGILYSLERFHVYVKDVPEVLQIDVLRSEQLLCHR